MSMFGLFAGYVSGIGITCYANRMARARYWAMPWRHLALGTAMGFVGYNLSKWEDEMVTEMNQIRANVGLPPVMDGNFDIWKFNEAKKESNERFDIKKKQQFNNVQ